MLRLFRRSAAPPPTVIVVVEAEAVVTVVTERDRRDSNVQGNAKRRGSTEGKQLFWITGPAILTVPEGTALRVSGMKPGVIELDGTFGKLDVKGSHVNLQGACSGGVIHLLEPTGIATFQGTVENELAIVHPPRDLHRLQSGTFTWTNAELAPWPPPRPVSPRRAELTDEAYQTIAKEIEEANQTTGNTPLPPIAATAMGLSKANRGASLEKQLAAYRKCRQQCTSAEEWRALALGWLAGTSPNALEVLVAADPTVAWGMPPTVTNLLLREQQRPLLGDALDNPDVRIDHVTPSGLRVTVRPDSTSNDHLTVVCGAPLLADSAKDLTEALRALLADGNFSGTLVALGIQPDTDPVPPALVELGAPLDSHHGRERSTDHTVVVLRPGANLSHLGHLVPLGTGRMTVLGASERASTYLNAVRTWLGQDGGTGGGLPTDHWSNAEYYPKLLKQIRASRPPSASGPAWPTQPSGLTSPGGGVAI